MKYKDIMDFKELDLPSLTTAYSRSTISYKNKFDSKTNKRPYTSRRKDYLLPKNKLFYLKKSALEIDTEKFVHFNKEVSNTDNNYEDQLKTMLISSPAKSKISKKEANNINSNLNAYSLSKVVEIINQKEKLKENQNLANAERILFMKKTIKEKLQKSEREKELRMKANNKTIQQNLEPNTSKRKRLENEQLLQQLDIKLNDNPFIDYHINEIKKTKRLFSPDLNEITSNRNENRKISKSSKRRHFSEKSFTSILNTKHKKSCESKKSLKFLDKSYLSDSEEDIVDEKNFVYIPENQKLQILPNEIQSLIKHQSDLLAEEYKNKDEYYNWVQSQEDLQNKCLITDNNIDEKKIYKINIKDTKQALNHITLTKKDKILNIFRNGVVTSKINQKQTNKTSNNIEAKMSDYKLKNIKKKIAIEEKPAVEIIPKNKLKEIYEKTNQWLDKNYIPLVKKMNNKNNTASKALKRENDIKCSEPFNLAERERFDEKFRICYNSDIIDYDKKIKNNLKNLTTNNAKLEQEVNLQVDQEIKNIKDNNYSQKQEKWKKCMVTAAIHFKRLGCSINEFYSNEFIIDKPYSKEGSWLFFQAVKNGEVDNVRRMLSENKFLVHDYDYHKQTPLHWAVKRKFNEIVEIIINSGASIDHKNTSGRTPLHLAAEYNNLEATIILLKEMADPLISDNVGKTASQLTKNEGILYYIKRVKALYIIYSSYKTKEAFEKIKNGIAYILMHESKQKRKDK